MEIRLSVVLLALLGGIAWSSVASDPVPALDPQLEAVHALSALEDSFALAHDDLAVARRLAAEYLRLGQPALAIGVIRGVAPALVADPVLTHRLAQGYEAVARLDDAMATASLAEARCLRALGSEQAPALEADLRFGCNPAVLVALEQHVQALDQMLRWGVTDPAHDPRAALARDLAERRARIASVDVVTHAIP